MGLLSKRLGRSGSPKLAGPSERKSCRTLSSASFANSRAPRVNSRASPVNLRAPRVNLRAPRVNLRAPRVNLQALRANSPHHPPGPFYRIYTVITVILTYFRRICVVFAVVVSVFCRRIFPGCDLTALSQRRFGDVAI
eukprot:757564-Prorocentrum_minimum.AAC.1